MSQDDLRKISAEVSKECWKKLKIISVQKEISLAECIKEILEKSVSKKVFEEVN